MIARPVDVMDPNYLTLLNLFNSQQKQAAANLKTHDEFLQLADNWKRLAQKQLDYGLPVPLPPVPPAMTVIHDDGSISHPPFADLRTPSLDPVTSPPVSMFGAPPALDRTDVLLAQMQIINSKMDLVLRLLPKAA